MALSGRSSSHFKVATGCLIAASVATAYQHKKPPQEELILEGYTEEERLLVSGGQWEPPTDFTQAKAVALEGGLPLGDTEALLDGIARASGAHGGVFMVTVTDGGMVDMAQNMLMSLDAVPSHAPRLVIGMGTDLCEEFQRFQRTTCVEVFRESGSEEEVAWGSHDYWQVVFRKHLVLTVVATSNIARGVIYTDPDIVYLDSPISYFIKLADSSDITFSPNNMLEADAESVEDLSKEYEKRGMANITLGPYRRRVDINTGLFHMKSSPVVSDLMVTTMRIFKLQEFVHGHYQQYSLVQALAQVPAIKIGVASGERFVNGNVFWGHRDLLRSARIVSVHANWMQPELKRKCLKTAGLWILGKHGPLHRLSIEGAADSAAMDARGATVVECTA